MLTCQNTTYERFKQEASIFFRATENRSEVTVEQADAGFKALSLMYFGSEMTDTETHSAVIILELASKRCFEVELSAAKEES